jgi:hypothetical protein
VIEQIEGLEHHTHLLTDLIYVTFFIGDTFSVNPDLTRRGCFKHIDTSYQG